MLNVTAGRVHVGAVAAHRRCRRRLPRSLAAEAIACGWSDLDVFGCDPDRPVARFDCMGLLMLLDRCEIVGIDEGGADLIASPEARLRYRRRPLPAATISLWQLGQGEGA